jgi:hypothetical protein
MEQQTVTISTTPGIAAGAITSAAFATFARPRLTQRRVRDIRQAAPHPCAREWLALHRCQDRLRLGRQACERCSHRLGEFVLDRGQHSHHDVVPVGAHAIAILGDLVEKLVRYGSGVHMHAATPIGERFPVF